MAKVNKQQSFRCSSRTGGSTVNDNGSRMSINAHYGVPAKKGKIMGRKMRLLAGCIAALFPIAGCTVGPKYHTPSVATPPAYKEVTPENAPQIDNWKVAQPNDAALRGKWWEIFNDPQLNMLEEQVNISNQNIASSAAAFLAARAMVKEARAQYFPTVTTSPSIAAGSAVGNLAAIQQHADRHGVVER